jgi:small subunit ribosomal protein S30e
MPTHGSLTKAGKVRAQTPKVESTPRNHPSPRRRNKINYVKRVVHAPQEPRFRGRGERY